MRRFILLASMGMGISSVQAEEAAKKATEGTALDDAAAAVAAKAAQKKATQKTPAARKPASLGEKGGSGESSGAGAKSGSTGKPVLDPKNEKTVKTINRIPTKDKPIPVGATTAETSVVLPGDKPGEFVIEVLGDRFAGVQRENGKPLQAGTVISEGEMLDGKPLHRRLLDNDTEGLKK